MMGEKKMVSGRKERHKRKKLYIDCRGNEQFSRPELQ